MLVQVRTGDQHIKTCSLASNVSPDKIVPGRDVAVSANKICGVRESSDTFKPPLPDRYCPPAQRSLDYFEKGVASFLKGSYKQINHLPSTGLGGFDVEY